MGRNFLFSFIDTPHVLQPQIYGLPVGNFVLFSTKDVKLTESLLLNHFLRFIVSSLEFFLKKSFDWWFGVEWNAFGYGTRRIFGDVAQLRNAKPISPL